MTAAHRAGLLLVVVGLVTAVTPAQGYVRTRTSRNHPVAWHRSCVFLTPHTDLAADPERLAALEASAAAWSDVGCSYLSLVVEPATPDAVVGFDPEGLNTNVVVAVEADWPHDPAAAGLTTLTYLSSSSSDVDGEVVDADIELNYAGFEFATDGKPDAHDVANVLTHELGHVVGLDHTCDDGSLDPPPTDDLGQVIPACQPLSGLSPEVIAATMFNYAYPGEVTKRTLEADDVEGICAIYPLAADPQRCEPVDYTPDGGCATVPAGEAGGLLLLGAVWLLHRRRRHRPRR